MSAGLIVFGDDHSASADVAWQWIDSHRWPDWAVDVVTAEVTPFPPPVWEYMAGPVELEPWEPPGPRVASAHSGLHRLRHLRAQADPRVVLGDRSDASLLVVGTGDLGRWRAVLVGSTAEWLLHYGRTPLLIARSGSPVRRVLACVDGSAHAQEAVETVAALPWIGDTDVTVLGVYDGWADTEAGTSKAIAALSQAGLAPKAVQVRGKAAPVILEEIEERRIDLVVVGRRGMTSWRLLRLGSTAGPVARAAPCNVLVARANPPADPGEE